MASTFTWTPYPPWDQFWIRHSDLDQHSSPVHGPSSFPKVFNHGYAHNWWWHLAINVTTSLQPKFQIHFGRIDGICHGRPFLHMFSWMSNELSNCANSQDNKWSCNLIHLAICRASQFTMAFFLSLKFGYWISVNTYNRIGPTTNFEMIYHRD